MYFNIKEFSILIFECLYTSWQKMTSFRSGQKRASQMCWCVRSEQMCSLIWQVESECRCVWNGRLFSRRSLLFCLALCYLCRSGVIALIRERRTHLPLSVCLSEGGRGHVTHMTLPARPLQLFTPASPEMTDSRGLVPAWSCSMTTLSTCHFTAPTGQNFSFLFKVLHLIYLYFI